MNNTLIFALIAAFSVLELMVLGGVLFFYLRLRRSEAMLNALQMSVARGQSHIY